MTSERRRARRSGGGAGIEIEGAVAPADLFDPDSPAWQTNEACFEWCRHNGIESPHFPAAMRLGFNTHPGNRRNYAAGSWAEKNRVLLDNRVPHPTADWNKLRIAGLIG